MPKNIQEIMIELKQNMFWGLGKVRASNKSQLEDFIQCYTIPHDFIELLTITDGFVLFNAGDYSVYDINFINELKKDGIYKPDFKDEMLTIGYFMGYYLLVNQNESHTNNYLYAGDACSYAQYVCVGSLTDFLNGFIDTKGEYFPFWEVDEKNYVSFEKV